MKLKFKKYFLLSSILFLFLIPNFFLNDSITKRNFQANSTTQNFIISDPNWNYNMVNGSEANKITNGSSDVIVAILDTGMDNKIREINSSLWINKVEIPNNNIDDDGNGYIDDINGWNFISNNNVVMDISGHGTFIATQFTGIGVETTGNVSKITHGLATGITLMPLKVIERLQSDNEEKYITGDFVKAIEYAVNNGAKIISISLTWTSPPKEVINALQRSYNSGVLLVSVSGNNAEISPGISSLSSINEMIAVGAVNNLGNRAEFSQFGEQLELMAPGEEIFGTVQVNGSVSGSLRVGEESYLVRPLEFSAEGTVMSELEYVGLGRPQDYDNIDLIGKIAVIDRGETFFRDKVSNATQRGATGAIIINNETSGLFSGTLVTHSTIPTVAISQVDGNIIKNKILAKTGSLLGEITVQATNTTDLSGTSFAAPHVSATAALMWSINPDLDNNWIRLILRRTSTDINQTGWDQFTGFGLLNASFAVESAGDKLKPEFTLEINSSNFLIATLKDNNGLYRIDFGYKKAGIDIIKSSKFFSGKVQNYVYLHNFGEDVSKYSYYFAIEDISGNRALLITGDIDYTPPDYAILFRSSDDGNSLPWNFIYVISSIFLASVVVYYKKRKIQG